MYSRLNTNKNTNLTDNTKMRADMNTLERIKEWAHSEIVLDAKDNMFTRAFSAGHDHARAQVARIIRESLEDEQKPAEAPYYIDYIYNNPSGENFYYQLVRKSDDAILYANPYLNLYNLQKGDEVLIPCRTVPREGMPVDK